MKRLLFDCSYTRLQTKEVGITRVVRKLAEELQKAPPFETVFDLVAYSRRGWHQVSSTSPGEISDAPLPSRGLLAPMMQLSDSPRVRRLIRDGLPVSAQVLAWNTFSRFTYGRIANSFPEVEIGAGDFLVLCDASWNYAVWPNVLRAKESGALVVTMVHDLIPLNTPQFCAPLLTEIFRRWLLGALAASDAIICNSRATRNELEAYCRENTLACPPLGYFRLGANQPEAPANDCDLTVTVSGIGAGGEAPFFLVVGSVEPRKNLSVVLDAFDVLWASGMDVHLVIAGRPADGADTTVQRIRNHPLLQRQLFFINSATDMELDALYRGAQALVFASYAEGFGLPLVEARQRGCQVIASRIPAFVELADFGVKLFNPDSASELQFLLRQCLEKRDEKVEPMLPFSWRDSAAGFKLEIIRLLG